MCVFFDAGIPQVKASVPKLRLADSASSLESGAAEPVASMNRLR